MRPMKFWGILGALAGVVACASAQEMKPCVQRGSRFSPRSIPRKEGVPFTARVRTEFFEKDPAGAGTYILFKSTEARTTSGKTFQENPFRCRVDAGKDDVVVRADRTSDKAERTNALWFVGDTDDHVASVYHFHEDAGQSVAYSQKLRARVDKQMGQSTYEHLGTRAVAGISASGFRRTRVIPAGTQGNSAPITVVDETWTSDTNEVTLIEIHDDPRDGKTISQVEEFIKGEPDAALFQVPAGYKVRESAAGKTTHPNVEKAPTQ